MPEKTKTAQSRAGESRLSHRCRHRVPEKTKTAQSRVGKSRLSHRCRHRVPVKTAESLLRQIRADRQSRRLIPTQIRTEKTGEKRKKDRRDRRRIRADRGEFLPQDPGAGRTSVGHPVRKVLREESEALE